MVHYQPIVRLSDATLVGFEALLRWQHPQRGLVAPGEFIPIAEECGLIQDIGRWVLRSACQQIVSLNAALPGSRSLSVGVNISSKQLGCDGFLAMVQDTLTDTSLPPQHLVLELTESALLENLWLKRSALKSSPRA